MDSNGLLTKILVTRLDDPLLKYCIDCSNLTFTIDAYQITLGLHAADPTVNNDTSYVCKGFNFDPLKTQHIIEFSPVVDNQQVLHHMILYSLPYDATALGTFPCLEMPADSFPLWVWAPGGTTLRPPPNAGIKVGKDTDVIFTVLQVHYDNPGLRTDMTDSSGVEMKLTPVLRRHDVGVLLMGTDLQSIALPPGVPDYQISGNCTAQRSALLPFELTLIRHGPHAHRLGRKIWTDQYRDGEIISRFGNPAYEFNHQRGYNFIDPVIWRPGDEFVTHCIYDTTEKTVTTYGGEGTSNEMCLNIIYYYPKIDAPFCLTKSFPVNKTSTSYTEPTAKELEENTYE